MIIITILLTILAIILTKIIDDDCNGVYWISSIGAILLGIIDLIIVIIIINFGIETFTIDDKIKMYQEENKNIEIQITTIIQNYQGYEKEIISNIADMEVILIKFPELSTSELVKTQMNVYIENNNTIKNLQSKKIETKIAKWLLYFGK